MLRFLWRLLVVGFPPKCEHDFGQWAAWKELSSNESGIHIIFQSRVCKKCGLAEHKKDVI